MGSVVVFGLSIVMLIGSRWLFFISGLVLMGR